MNNSPFGRKIPASAKVLIAGSGNLFKGRKPLVEAFTSLGPSVQQFATSADFADKNTRIVQNGALRKLVFGCSLVLVMTRASRFHGPLENDLTCELIRQALSCSCAVGLTCEAPGIESNEVVKSSKTMISFIVAPSKLRTTLNGKGLGMNIIGSENWTHPERAEENAKTMLQYISLGV